MGGNSISLYHFLTGEPQMEPVNIPNHHHSIHQSFSPILFIYMCCAVCIYFARDLFKKKVDHCVSVSCHKAGVHGT